MAVVNMETIEAELKEKGFSEWADISQTAKVMTDHRYPKGAVLLQHKDPGPNGIYFDFVAANSYDPQKWDLVAVNAGLMIKSERGQDGGIFLERSYSTYFEPIPPKWKMVEDISKMVQKEMVNDQFHQNKGLGDEFSKLGFGNNNALLYLNSLGVFSFYKMDEKVAIPAGNGSESLRYLITVAEAKNGKQEIAAILAQAATGRMTEKGYVRIALAERSYGPIGGEFPTKEQIRLEVVNMATVKIENLAKARKLFDDKNVGEKPPGLSSAQIRNGKVI